MEQVRKDHYFAFHKHLLVCNLALCPNFLKEIQVHYDKNFEWEMLTEKLQMLTYTYVFPKQKLVWLK